MYNLILENAAGDQLTFGMESPFTISEISGLDAPEATISTADVALMDGAKYISAKANMRQLNIAFAIEYEAAKNRLAVYNVLQIKQPVKMIYNSEYRNVYAEGFIQNVNISHFAMKQIVTCTILCPEPYFKSVQMAVDEMRNVIDSFHFPFSSTAEPQLVFGYFATDVGITVENAGDVECGMIIELYASDTITNPKIYDYITQEFIGLNVTMQAADLITIDTNAGHKTATLLRNGVETNIFNSVIQNSTWLQLAAAGSTFVYEVGSGNASSLSVTFKHTDLYEGV